MAGDRSVMDKGFLSCFASPSDCEPRWRLPAAGGAGPGAGEGERRGRLHCPRRPAGGGPEGQAALLGKDYRPGSVIGTAMEGLDAAAGSGLIWVPVSPR